MKAEDLSAPLATRLAEATGAERVTIAELRPMTGGAAREAWQLDATFEGGGQTKGQRQLVLLVFRPGGGPRSLSAANEFHLLEAAHAAGVPVASPLTFGDDLLGRSFYVMERVVGETIGRRLVRDERYAHARSLLPEQLAAALAAIHRVSVDQPALASLARPPAGSVPAEVEVARLEELYRLITLDPHPVFEVAFRWLRARLPQCDRVALVHGDFRIGNVMVDAETGLRAVLDWELAHVGDPLEDLGWACVRSWRFGRDELTCGGVGMREELFAAYEQATGRRVDRDAAHFWEVFGNLRWGVFTLVQVRGFLDGVAANVELASIGRRAAETEWELLNLIEGTAF